jgi:hypothetical protein
LLVVPQDALERTELEDIVVDNQDPTRARRGRSADRRARLAGL